MRRLLPAVFVLVLVPALFAQPADACHRMEPDQVSVGDPQSGPYLSVFVLRGCGHATGVCVAVVGAVECYGTEL